MLKGSWLLKKLYRYPSLRVAYIDEREDTVNGKQEKFYYSVLVKGGDKLDEVCIDKHDSDSFFFFFCWILRPNLDISIGGHVDYSHSLKFIFLCQI